MGKTQIKTRSSNLSAILPVTAVLSSALLLGIMLIRLRFVALSCMDSMNEYALSRQCSLKEMFLFTFDFCKRRGRLGVVFPLICTIRHFINSTGNETLIWLMQYVPVVSVVLYIAYLLYKRINKTLSALFLVLVTVFLQVDTCHNLLICYPLDFMAALFFSVLSLDLFSRAACDYFAGSFRKKDAVFLILSCIAYYISLEAYESFIVMALPMAIVAVAFAIKSGKEGDSVNKSSSAAGKAVKILVPHFAVSVIYIVIWYVLSQKIYSLVDEVYMTDEFSVPGFAVTWACFSGDLFPFRRYITYKVTGAHADWFSLGDFVKSPLNILGTVLTIVSVACILTAVRRNVGNIKERVKEIKVIFWVSAAFALFFAMPHSLLPRYQQWVTEEHVQGYVPSFICYVFWMVALSSLILLLYVKIAGKKTTGLVITVALVIITLFGYVTTTMTSNRYIEASQATVLKARAFLLCSRTGEFDGIDLIYTDSFEGLHGNIKNDESLFDYESGTTVSLTNELPEESDDRQPDAYMHAFDNGVLILCTTDENGISYGDARIFAVRSGDYDIIFNSVTGEKIYEYVTLGNDGYMPVYVDGVILSDTEVVLK